MAMTKETFNVYYDALRTICKAYHIEPLKTIDHIDRVKIELIGAVPQRPYRFPIYDYMDGFVEYNAPYMEFEFPNATANVYDLIKFTRQYFNNSLDVTTTNDINKIWEELLMKNFTKDDLRNGDFVIRRDGVKGVVIIDTGTIASQSGGFVKLDSYNTEMNCFEHIPIPDLDIMKVYRGIKCFDDCELLGALVYDRESVEVEEMTLEQVCKALGKNIKIVKG